MEDNSEISRVSVWENDLETGD